MRIPFDQPLPKKVINVEDKSRSNLYTWRGQFTPELIENLLKAYCPIEGTVLDPFCGSGTVLYESGKQGLTAYGVEVNPSAYILSKTYEFINVEKNEREKIAKNFIAILNEFFPAKDILSIHSEIQLEYFVDKINEFRDKLTEKENILLDAFVILLDIYKNKITPANIQTVCYNLSSILNELPFSKRPIRAILGDARSIALAEKSIDFVITSPPYINVFNYHQNYRKSAEVLGWNLLEIAKSEIGSNRANRGNRFVTVIQYCIDMMNALQELYRLCKEDAKLILIVGYESTVLGVPFYNANIIASLAKDSGLFELVITQTRRFKNKFGKIISEDILHFVPKQNSVQLDPIGIARNVALSVLQKAKFFVPEKNKEYLEKAISTVEKVEGTPVYEYRNIPLYSKTTVNNTRIQYAELSKSSL